MGAPRQLEAQALLLRSIASALDAGLPVDEILSGPASSDLPGASPPGTPISQALAERGFPLRGFEQRLLAAAEQSGRIDQSLLQLASDREEAAELRRRLRTAMLRPVLTLAVACLTLVFLFVLGLGQGGPAMLLVSALLAAGWFGFRIRRSIDHPARPGAGLALAEGLLRDWGEVPYLRAMHGLYAAGVGLPQAHEIATGACPLAALRQALRASAQFIDKGQGYAEALTAGGALNPETRSLLHTAEQAGDLEDCFARALRRRTQAFQLQAERALRWASFAASLLTYAVVGWLVLGFYADYAGRLFGGR